jgi:cobalamin biosynthesis protein CobD/CbiB
MMIDATYIARGAGMLAGMFGYKHEEYKKVHGT